MRLGLDAGRGHRKLKRSFGTDQGALGKVVEMFFGMIIYVCVEEMLNHYIPLVQPRTTS